MLPTDPPLKLPSWKLQTKYFLVGTVDIFFSNILSFSLHFSFLFFVVVVAASVFFVFIASDFFVAIFMCFVFTFLAICQY